MAIVELDLSGLEIESYSWQGDRLRVKYGGGYGDAAVVGPAHGLWGWTVVSDCLPDAAGYNNLVGGLPRMQYYQQFIRDHITGDTEIFIIDFRGKKFHASFVENSITGAMHSYDVFGMEGVQIEMRRIPGASYNSDGSIGTSGLTLGGTAITLNGDTLTLT
ncbi:MAG: hypothetical protein JO053_01495 [Acidobacteria bacterium]|nr:hypothetical protein [Acidobacteriota bacterium]